MRSSQVDAKQSGQVAFSGKERLSFAVMTATEAEMDAALLPQKYRDYCAHLALNYMRCRSEKYPWFASCKHEKHENDHCEYEE